MFGKDLRGSISSRLDIDLADGWIDYRQALDLLAQCDWSRSLMLLAEAETTFRTVDDHQGLWRALIGQ